MICILFLFFMFVSDSPADLDSSVVQFIFVWVVYSSGEQKWTGEKEFVSLYFFDTIDLQFTPRCKRWAVWRSPYNSTTGTFFQSI